MVTNIARKSETNDTITYTFSAEWDWQVYEQALYQGVTIINNTPAFMWLVLDLTNVQSKDADIPDFIDRIPPLFLPNHSKIIVIGGTLLAKNVFYHLHFRYHTDRHPVLLVELPEDITALN